MRWQPQRDPWAALEQELISEFGPLEAKEQGCFSLLCWRAMLWRSQVPGVKSKVHGSWEMSMLSWSRGPRGSGQGADGVR